MQYKYDKRFASTHHLAQKQKNDNNNDNNDEDDDDDDDGRNGMAGAGQAENIHRTFCGDICALWFCNYL